MLSFSGKKWNIGEVASDCDVGKIVNIFNIPEVIARLLINRGLQRVEDIEGFLNPKIKNLMPDPLFLVNMDKAVKRIVYAIEKQEKIFILGDYDVDGITSTYLLVQYLKSIK
ncbi:MAG: single-stranded-DNA-specific exonuclease RecJ, partial [Holosporales bacterium]|nr:single-stranded-DNA-specific exonuclease RecJ [Holosporales bacterium]